MSERAELDETSPLRVRLPEVADIDSARSAIDASLRLLGVDLHNGCHLHLQEELGEDWAEDGGSKARHRVEPLDPQFWLNELVLPQSPARRAFPFMSRHWDDDLRRTLAIRNTLYHFRASYDAHSARRELVAIRDLARKLQLPCQREVHALAKRLYELSAGKSAPPLSLKQGIELHETVRNLRAQLDGERQAKEQAEEVVERARDQASAVEERLARLQADKTTAQSERDNAQRELNGLRGHVQDLEQEADRRQDHVDELRADLDDPEDALQELDPTAAKDDECLAHLYAGIVGLLRLVEQQFTEFTAADRLQRMAKGIAHQLSLLDSVGVSHHHAVTVPSVGVSEWTQQQFAAALALSESPVHSVELLPLDEENQAALRMLRGFIPEHVTLGREVAGLLAEWGRQSVDLSHGSEEPDSGGLPEPGEPWPYERGTDIWVLSAMRRELRSPRGKHGSLADSIGHARAERLAATFLAIRPEGGRVYIDADGDAATPGPDGLMYLGNINEAQDPDLSVAQR